MYQAYRFSFRKSVWWTRHSLTFVTLYSTLITSVAYFSEWSPAGDLHPRATS
jgi:hypothetical protein